MEPITAETLKEKKGQIILIAVLVAGCAYVFWPKSEPKPPKPAANQPAPNGQAPANTAPQPRPNQPNIPPPPPPRPISSGSA